MKKGLCFVLSFVLLISMVAIDTFFINTKEVIVREEIISSDKIPESFDGVTIAFFADTHFDKDDGYEFIKAINLIYEYRPDMVLFGGDLIDDDKTIKKGDDKTMISYLSNIDCKYGKYAVLGNHDVAYDVRYQYVLNVFKQSNFTVLENEAVNIYSNENDFINIVGVNCPIRSKALIDESYKNVDDDHFTLTMMHVPDLFDELPLDKTDYVLAGHSHGGQVYLPILNHLYRPYGCTTYFKGKYIKDGITLDITNGVGYTLKSARLFANAEIVIYHLKAI